MENKKNNKSFLAVSFRQGFISPNVPIATFSQGDKDIVFLLDTGSDNNVIDKSALEYIGYTKLKDTARTTLSGVNGTTEVENCSIQFSCGEDTYKTNFLIADLSEAFGQIKKEHCITIHGILGSNFLRNHNVVLDFNNLTAYSKK